MKIVASMTAMTNFERNIRRLLDKRTYEKPVETLIKEIAKLAKQYAPRDTGDLEESIMNMKLGFGKFAIVANMPYASHMEFGTRYFPVGTAENPRARTSTSGKACFHPFLRSATYEMMNEYPKMIKKAIFGMF